MEKGFKELVLTGVCLGSWGRGLDRNEGLAGIAEKISQIKGNFRIRFSSIEPVYVTDEIIEAVKNNDKICKHLHIPLQSGDDRILKLMRRPYTARKFADIVKKIRRRIAGAAITTDVLAGFPGEDEKKFRNTVKFIKRLKPSRMHVFSYSKREGTAAAEFKQNVDEKTVKERVKFLTDLSNEFSTDFARRFIGKRQSAIIETERDRRTGLLCGYTDNYIRVLVNGPDSLKNKLLPVVIDRLDSDKNIIFAYRAS